VSIKINWIAALLLTAVMLARSRNPAEAKAQKNADPRQQIGYKSAQDAAQRNALLLKDLFPLLESAEEYSDD
jgi:hypothetical protein